MEEQLANSKHHRRIRTLLALVLTLVLIIFNPAIRLGVRESLPRRPIRLGESVISIPKSWKVSQRPSGIAASNTCMTIFCNTPARASIFFKVREPGSSDEAWENSARKIIEKDYSGGTDSFSISSGSGLWRCGELESNTPDGRAVVSCMSSDLGLDSMFLGEPSLKPAFTAILESVHAGNP
jgi:hypothetical protein